LKGNDKKNGANNNLDYAATTLIKYRHRGVRRYSLHENKNSFLGNR
jgi:hypothetical protein